MDYFDELLDMILKSILTLGAIYIAIHLIIYIGG